MKLAFYSMVLGTALALASCGADEAGTGTPADEIAETYITEINKIADVLDTIESEEDLEAAALQLQDAAANLQGVMSELDGKLTSIKAMRVLGSRAGDLMSSQQRLASAVSAAAQRNPELMQKIQAEIKKIPMK